MSDRLQARRDRLQKRIDKPDPFIAKQSPEVIERFNRQAEEDIVDIEEELELIDARLSGDSGAAERLEIVKANRLLESEKAGLQETIDSNKEQSGLGGRVPVSALNRIISKAEKDIAKIDKEIEKNNAELERLTPAVDADLTPEQVKEIRETVGFDAKVEKARSFGISDETLAPIIARFQ
jgi:DNA-binding transcriptional regulator YiaG